MPRPTGLPFPPWILVLDLAGVLMVLAGAASLFAGFGRSMGVLGAPALAWFVFGLGLTVILASALLILFHLRRRQER